MCLEMVSSMLVVVYKTEGGRMTFTWEIVAKWS
jgi:hypothetical protein